MCYKVINRVECVGSSTRNLKGFLNIGLGRVQYGKKTVENMIGVVNEEMMQEMFLYWMQRYSNCNDLINL